MQEFIQKATSQFGINQDQAEHATGGLLNFLKKQADGHDVDALIAKIPGAEEIMNSESSSSETGGSGMLGGLGGKLGGAGGALAILQNSGLDAGRAKSFVTMLVDYAKQKAGPDTVDQVLAKVPAFKNLMQ